jgi:predicted permease
MNNSIYLLKQAWAGLSAKKGFLVTVTTTLGLTLGALLCILTLAYVVISKPLPYPEQEHLYQVNANIIDQTGKEVYQQAFSYPSLIHFYENQTQFSQSALIRYEEGILSSLPEQPTIYTNFITPSWFDLLGSKMALGRSFEETENKDTYNPVVVLTYETWQREFNGDKAILEQTVTIGETNFRVVGVLAKSFIEPELAGTGIKADVFLPWDYNSANLNPRYRESFGNWTRSQNFVGKIDNKLSIPQIEQSLTPLANSYWRENVSDSSDFEGWSLKIELQSFKQVILGDTQNTILLLLAGVVGLILIACTNITNLFMSRTADQQRELSIQAAVGASKHHLFKALFAQSGLVVFISGGIALAVATGGFWVLQQYLAQRLPRVNELAINSVTLGSALLIALLLGLFFARVSTRMINYRALNSALQSSGKGTGIQVSPAVRRWLIISQVTVVTLLVFVNITLLRDSLKVINKPLGLETDNIATLRIKVSGNLPREDIEPLSKEFKNKLLALPQVEDVAQAPSPLGYQGYRPLTHQATGEQINVRSKYIDDRYFQITGQTLSEGDFFSEADFNDENQLIIINDVYAKKLFPSGSALGTKLTIFGDVLTVSGVVKSTQIPTESEVPMRAYMINSWSWDRFVIKLKPNQTLSRELAATTAKEASPLFLIHQLETLNEQRDRLLFTQYTTAITSAVLAALTFFIATIGLYGILNYATQMRRLELGTRLAIGAKRKDIIKLVIKDNAGAVGIGIVISVIIMLVLSIGFSEALSGYMNIQLVSLLSATLGLISIMTLFACYWPLRPIVNSPVTHSLRGSE